MAKVTRPIIPTEGTIANKIHMIRDRKVMLDYDLAEMYKVETKQLKRQVRRNIGRFPEDFMFELTPTEYNSLRSQNGTLKQGEHSKYVPMAFTEQGVAMFVFTRMRELLLTHKDILLKLKQLEKRVVKNSEDIQLIFVALKKLFTKPQEPRRRIGFRRANERN